MGGPGSGKAQATRGDQEQLDRLLNYLAGLQEFLVELDEREASGLVDPIVADEWRRDGRVFETDLKLALGELNRKGWPGDYRGDCQGAPRRRRETRELAGVAS